MGAGLAGCPGGLNLAFVGLAIVWGFLVPALGMTQDQLLVGDAHWVVQLLHLLVGMGAMGLAEGLAAGIKQPRTQALQP